MTGAQAQGLAKLPGVVAVTKQQLVKTDTSSTPSFLGLNDEAKRGLWTKAGGNLKGEGVIIGIVDSGIWPESLSFTDRVDSNGRPAAKGFLAYQQIPGWHGKCVPGEGFNASMCNQKLIGAQYFNAAWGGNAGIADEAFASPRDFGGHGTHTASTAGGNANVPTTQDAAPFGSVSGIAPRARIAAYKALWETPTGGSGFNSDLVAAIDQAVADGVDVINYSVSGTSTNFADPVEIAFLFAADAGVFVAASAGNSGPTTSTVAHPSPWTTTVAAGTHNRNGTGSVTLGNGATYSGASFAGKTGPAPLIDATAAGVDGADPTQLGLCYGAADGAVTLDPAKVTGKIVVCKRGVTARVNKSLAVKEAGGGGTDDLDLHVYKGAIPVGSSGSGTSAEEVSLVNPAAGTYTVYVHGWGTDGPDANYTLFQWPLGSVDAGNMTVTAPNAGVMNGTATVSLSFSGLEAKTKYLGSVAYGGDAAATNPTIVRVDTP